MLDTLSTTQKVLICFITLHILSALGSSYFTDGDFKAGWLYFINGDAMEDITVGVWWGLLLTSLIALFLFKKPKG